VENNSTWMPSQPSPASWKPNAFAPVPSVLFALGAVFFTFAPIFLYLILAVAGGRLDPRHPAGFSAIDQIYAQILSYAVVLPYMLYFLPRVSGRSLADLGIRTPTLREIGIGVAGVVVMFFTVSAASAIIVGVTHIHDTEAAVALLQQMKTPFDKTVFILVAAVLAPIVEEMAFRAFLFNAFARYVPVAAAAIGSGIVFGLVHAQPGSQSLLSISLPLALGGIVLAYVYRTARCYWSDVITHALFNSISLVAVFGFHVKS
jgi:membrane protease YdiL (CAAX protease family)